PQRLVVVASRDANRTCTRRGQRDGSVTDAHARSAPSELEGDVMEDHVDTTSVPSRPEHGHMHHNRRALGAARGRLQKKALKLAGYLVVAYLVVRLIPTLEEALNSLKQVR